MCDLVWRILPQGILPISGNRISRSISKVGVEEESLWGIAKSVDEVVLDFKKAGEEKEGNEESEEDEVGDQAEEVVGEIVESGRVNARAWEFHGGI